MTPLFRPIVLVLALLLANGCATHRTTTAPAKNEARGDTDSANFMKDPATLESWRWLCRAAARGHTAAQYAIAIRYRDGLPPVTRNLPRAYLWFTVAQRGGLSAATLALDDVMKDLTEEQRTALQHSPAAATEADCRDDEGLDENL